MTFEKSVRSIYTASNSLPLPLSLFHKHATHMLSVWNEVYYNVRKYEYLTFQTHIHLHKQFIFDTITTNVKMRLFSFQYIYIGHFANVLGAVCQ